MAHADWKIERWVFTQNELMNPQRCNRDDLFVSQPCGRQFAVCGILVNRLGEATNRWADGTVGISTEQAAAAEAEETLTSFKWDGENADTWLEVVTKNGMFVQFWCGVVDFEIHEIKTTKLSVRADSITEAIAIATVGPLQYRLLKENVVESSSDEETELVFVANDSGNCAI